MRQRVCVRWAFACSAMGRRRCFDIQLETRQGPVFPGVPRGGVLDGFVMGVRRRVEGCGLQQRVIDFVGDCVLVMGPNGLGESGCLVRGCLVRGCLVRGWWCWHC